MANQSIYAAFERMWQHISAKLNTKADSDHTHDDYYTESEVDAKLTEVKSYADGAASTVKNDLLNGAGDAYDTLKELGDLINNNQDAISALETIATNKADKDHTHSWDDLEKVIPIATDEEIIDMLAQEDMLNAVTDSDGSILTDENNDILLW